MKMEVHELKLNSWDKLKKLRLQALNEFPNVFSESYVDAASKSNDYWIELAQALAFPNSQRMFIARLNNQEVGFVFALNDKNSELIGRLGGMWVAKSAQKKRVGQQLCERVITWAKENNKQNICLWVDETNSQAIRLYQKNSFSFTSKKWNNPSDTKVILLEMELRIL